MIPLRSIRFVLAGLAFTALSAYGCGGNVVVDGTNSTSGGGAGQGGSGHGGSGQGGTTIAMCPTSPPNNGDPCTGFAAGDQCNYQSASSGVILETECQCSSQGWSCGSEGAATTGAGP
jgi:hypothetical protein